MEKEDLEARGTIERKEAEAEEYRERRRTAKKKRPGTEWPTRQLIAIAKVCSGDLKGSKLLLAWETKRRLVSKELVGRWHTLARTLTIQPYRTTLERKHSLLSRRN
ncbi:hypothetical protein WN51_04872 [Melipona quadrifasciata]|uniref:Uncharacterized protein n=1 Tax=Melipona quadrifasciata TaxID=166423 RepID=A0A0N0U404_9HYME|nr:hypothetical protein WN51_04872 [Melipona quadrifasciata]